MTSVFGLDLKKSPTLAERRRLTFKALASAFGAAAVSLTSSATTTGTAGASAATVSLENH